VIALDRLEGRPLLIGHRGAASLAPENTLASIRAATAAGVDLVEFDVLELASGELVLAHSNDLREVSHGRARGTVGDKPLSELLEIAPHLPTFDAALEVFRDEAPHVGVHVDLKSAQSVEKVASTLRRFGLVGRTLVSSVHLSALRRLSRLEPGLRTGASYPRDRLGVSGRRGSEPVIRVVLQAARPLTPIVARALLARSRASALVLHHGLVTERLVRVSHARGIPVVAWTVDDPLDATRLDEAGVDALVVNNPATFVFTLES
jgi:glycerophosphoryl diester phosphodiesterase